jgi:Spy/CpxP family protein refolding chaperone
MRFESKLKLEGDKSMTATRKIVTLVLGVVLATGFLIAQGPPGPPDPATMAQHQLKFLNTVLSLSAAQQQQALTIFTNAANSESGVHEGMRSAHEALDAAVKNNDNAGITQAATNIGNLMAQSVAAHAKANAAFYQILTPDQQAKFNQLEDQGPGFAVGFGPGFGFDMKVHHLGPPSTEHD